MNEIAQRTKERISDRLVGLIDIVFAVVVGANLVAIFFGNSLQEWPSLYEVINLPNMSLLLAYVAVVLSWVGYHRMIELNPYSLNKWGYIRFGIDFVIVFTYTVLMYSRESFSIFLAMFPLIFLLYACGGIVRMKEYGKVSWPKGSLIYTGLFLLNWITYFIWSSLVLDHEILESIPMSWVVWFLTLLYLFYYRWQREKKGFRRKG